MNDNESVKLLAAALYEIRCQLGNYLGSQVEIDPAIRLSAHLAYAVHNEAKQIIEGKDSLGIEKIKIMITASEKLVGCKYADHYKVFGSE